MDINDWEILKQLTKKFLDTVEMAYVFGGDNRVVKIDNPTRGYYYCNRSQIAVEKYELGNALLSTSDGKVFGIGRNLRGCLGLGNTKSCGLPSEMKLSNKGLKGLISGGANQDNMFVIAHLDSGEIFWWGSVPFPQNHIITTPEKVSIDLKIRVKTVACGAFHCAVLSDDGKVFTCGRNDAGQLGHEALSKQEITEPNWKEHYGIMYETNDCFGASSLRRVKGILENEAVTDVSCGFNFTVVLLDDGRVAAWGQNDGGQLGINTRGDFSGSPVEVVSLRTYYGAVIVKIVCGKNHVLALSQTRSLYVWGNNDNNQMGIPKVAIPEKGCPKEVSIEDVRFSDIGASYLCDISVAQSKNGKIYYWGETTKGCVSEPTVSDECKSINDVFVSLATPKVMIQPMRRTENSPKKSNEQPKAAQKITLTETLKKQGSSDLTLMVDGWPIHVHKNILKMKSKYFNMMITTWLKENQRIFEVGELSYTATEPYLKYLYTDIFEVNLSQAVELLKLAVMCADTELKSLCQNSIQHYMKPSEVADIFALTRKLVDCQALNRFSLDFALRHAKEVVQSAGFERWPEDTTKDFLREYVKMKEN